MTCPPLSPWWPLLWFQALLWHGLHLPEPWLMWEIPHTWQHGAEHGHDLEEGPKFWETTSTRCAISFTVVPELGSSILESVRVFAKLGKNIKEFIGTLTHRIKWWFDVDKMMNSQGFWSTFFTCFRSSRGIIWVDFLLVQWLWVINAKKVDIDWITLVHPRRLTYFSTRFLFEKFWFDTFCFVMALFGVLVAAVFSFASTAMSGAFGWKSGFIYGFARDKLPLFHAPYKFGGPSLSISRPILLWGWYSLCIQDPWGIRPEHWQCYPWSWMRRGCESSHSQPKAAWACEHCWCRAVSRSGRSLGSSGLDQWMMITMQMLAWWMPWMWRMGQLLPLKATCMYTLL